MQNECLDPQTLGFGGRFQTCLPHQMTREVAQEWFDCPEAMQEYLAGLAISPFVVTPDRSVKPQYPVFVKEVLHPELECEGPVKFHLRSGLTQWLHDKQKGGYTIGNVICEHLKGNGMLASCLNLQDGLAIQAKGIAVFRKLFQGKALPLWKSVVRFGDGRLSVPYLCDVDGQVVVNWCWLGVSFRDDRPALRFASN